MYFSAYFVPWHLFIFVKYSPKIDFVSNSCHWCDMMYDVMLCDDMMREIMLMPKTHSHAKTQSFCPLRNDQNLFAAYFSASPLIFRCKFCIPLGTSFELLRLLFQWYFSR
jgi:uncharacterized CHY-type Zn-finger protein